MENEMFPALSFKEPLNCPIGTQETCQSVFEQQFRQLKFDAKQKTIRVRQIILLQNFRALINSNLLPVNM